MANVPRKPLFSAKQILHQSAQNDRADVVKDLLLQGVSPNYRLPERATALSIFASRNNLEMCALLLLNGADPDLSHRNIVGGGDLENIRHIALNKNNAKIAAVCVAMGHGFDGVTKQFEHIKPVMRQVIAMPPLVAAVFSRQSALFQHCLHHKGVDSHDLEVIQRALMMADGLSFQDTFEAAHHLRAIIAARAARQALAEMGVDRPGPPLVDLAALVSSVVGPVQRRGPSAG